VRGGAWKEVGCRVKWVQRGGEKRRLKGGQEWVKKGGERVKGKDTGGRGKESKKEG